MEANADLSTHIRACMRCKLGELRSERGGYAVPAEVGANAEQPVLGLIGEAPGAQEDATGFPFQGAAGRILNGILRDAEISRDEVILLNRVRCRPPRNNLKSLDGAAALVACDDWTKAEIEVYNPRVIILLGGNVLPMVFPATARVGETRGTVRATGADHEYGARLWVATYHPASLLPNRSPRNRDVVVEDFRLAKALLTE